jgi:hypothetical protein
MQVQLNLSTLGSHITKYILQYNCNMSIDQRYNKWENIINNIFVTKFNFFFTT